MNESLLRSFGAFVSERQRIWHRRCVQKLSPPWTADPILRDHHFTNVYRMLDPGSAYAVAAVRDAPTPADALWFVVAYRSINRQSTFNEFGRVPYREDVELFLSYLDERYARKLPVSTAYHLTPSRTVFARMIRSPLPDLPRSTVDAFRTLVAMYGVGWFTGWQMHADLTWGGMINYDPDFVVVGTGATVAINALTGDPDAFTRYAHHNEKTFKRARNDVANDKYAIHVRHLRDTQGGWLHADFPFAYGTALTCVDVEHALCEWTRWMRCAFGIGKTHKRRR